MAIRHVITALAMCFAIIPHAVAQERALDPALEIIDAQFRAFEVASHALEDAAVAYCNGEIDDAAYRAAFEASWRAWAPLDSYQFGPVERDAVALSVNFWPDKKNFTGRAVRDILNATPEDQASADFIAGISAAGQGFPALELLMSEAGLTQCPAVIGISAYMHRRAENVYAAWFGEPGWAALMRDTGADNPVYRDDSEALRALITAIDFGMTRLIDMRLGRPLGTYDRPFPTRAEGYRAGLSLSIIEAQFDGLAVLIMDGLGPMLSEDSRAQLAYDIDAAATRLERIDGPLDQAVVTPATRIQVESAKAYLETLKGQVAAVSKADLGLGAGFSPADGD